MQIEIIFQSNSTKYTISGVKDVYTKDGLLCVSTEDKIVKYPLCNIFSVTSDYSDERE